MSAARPPEQGDDQDRPADGGRRSTWVGSIASDDRFRASNALSPAAFLDAGLPLALFTVVYSAGGRNLTVSLWVALAVGALLALVRLIRREPLQNVVAGFLGLGIAAFWSHRTGQPEDVFLPGLLINVGYGTAYLVSIVVRWPLLGILVGLATGQGMAWRRDPALMRAYTLASALWVGMFALRLAVQAPLYFAGEDQLGWLAGTRLVMSWPLFLLVAYLSWVIIRPAYRAHQAAVAESQAAADDAAAAAAGDAAVATAGEDAATAAREDAATAAAAEGERRTEPT
ncbi:DUF3159 domain-containing protein [Phytoactinopolyspora halotolerans]|uniref:DUF3159 domain-containing protein n=1 Tax=Phytoactinopolyspora halotolerans TaxID=1981512 RepID=A0A6L9S8M4_9ACTN|nr:DUF3159 domain-containing protein [Phytoactinopolyspora halotolerans]NEE01419.1 DUF3159 domain-containing protein [Phytoactinopolyspora halotolerans]